MKINIGAGKFKKPGWVRIDHGSGHYKHYGKFQDVDIDFMKSQRFPMEDDSVDVAYCSHVFEHLPDEVIKKIIQDTFRVLKPGGIFRITCPDAIAGTNAMLNNDNSFFSLYDEYAVFNEDRFKKKYSRTIPLKDASIYQKYMYMVMSPKCIHIDVPCEKFTDEQIVSLFDSMPMGSALDVICKPIDPEIHQKNPWMHISWWSIGKITSILKAAGFSEAGGSDYGQSRCEEMRDTEHFDKVFPHFSLYVEAVK